MTNYNLDMDFMQENDLDFQEKKIGINLLNGIKKLLMKLLKKLQKFFIKIANH